MKLFQIVGVGRLWLSHHGRTFFSLPNPAKTTITRPSKLLYDYVVNSESRGVEGGRWDVDSDDENDDAKDAPQVHRHRRQASAGTNGAPPRTTDASSSEVVGAFMFQTVLDRLD